ncbi:MAG: amidohydrolase family protein [Bacteroidales bacterium]|nr:amidohydrolase family protein [Bacteroidales bacterium]
MSILLKNATYVDWKTLEFKQTNIIVNQEISGKIEFTNNIENNNFADIIDCSNLLVTKSFALGHHHAYSALARGMPAPKKTPNNFNEILQYIWWNIDKLLDKEMIEASALATAIACAKAGSTFVIDHHSSQNHIKGSLQILANAFEKVGLSHLLCYEISDRDGAKKTKQAFEETESYLQNNQALIGLHASFTLGDNSLKTAQNLMQKYNSGIHIHVAEDKYDQTDSINKYGKRVVERLNDFGFLNSSKTILAHCLHIDDNERDIINKSNSFVVQNTESNLNNQVGNFNSAGLGNNIMFGTDGMHSDMIKSAQFAYFAGLAHDNINFDSMYARLRNSHNYLSINNFEGDNENNLVILDYDSPTQINQNNFLGHLIFGINSKHIKHVISKGKLIVEDYKIKNINEKEVLKFTKEQANRLWQKLKI